MKPKTIEILPKSDQNGVQIHEHRLGSIVVRRVVVRKDRSHVPRWQLEIG